MHLVAACSLTQRGREGPGVAVVEEAVDIGGENLGESDDLGSLVFKHGDSVYRLAFSIVRDSSLAEDVAQETLVKAWLALPTFRGTGSMRGWVLRIAHNTAVSFVRSARTTSVDPADLIDLTTEAPNVAAAVGSGRVSEVVGGVSTVEVNVQSSAVMDEFVKALDLLDELSRSIVVLRELEQLSYDEVSEILEVPLPTVKTRLLRARRRLGSALREWA